MDKHDLDEGRPGCFVAITRAKQTLTLTRALVYGGWSKGPAQFLHEMAGTQDLR